VFDVLRRPYFVPRISQSFIDGVRRMFSKAELVTITERIAVCRDPTDDRFLELAINGRAAVLVTGDLDLLVLSPFRGLPIITPRVFIQEIGRDA
jgi:putative PIN family toxin of toxin-antitoxin system